MQDMHRGASIKFPKNQQREFGTTTGGLPAFVPVGRLSVMLKVQGEFKQIKRPTYAKRHNS